MNPIFLQLINAAGTALAIAAIMVLLNLNGLVHVSLYEYGLWFDYEWAIPYWTFERLMFGLLGIFVGLNVFSMMYIFLSRRDFRHGKANSDKPKPAINHLRREVKEVKPDELNVKERKLHIHARGMKDDVEVMALPMVCNKCGKVFTQPLCMFDFKSGKPRLVNVCPYCSAVLAVSGNSTT